PFDTPQTPVSLETFPHASTTTNMNQNGAASGVGVFQSSSFQDQPVIPNAQQMAQGRSQHFMSLQECQQAEKMQSQQKLQELQHHMQEMHRLREQIVHYHSQQLVQKQQQQRQKQQQQ